MAVYLTISLSISLFMNWYNAHVALVERRAHAPAHPGRGAAGLDAREPVRLLVVDGVDARARLSVVAIRVGVHRLGCRARSLDGAAHHRGPAGYQHLPRGGGRVLGGGARKIPLHPVRLYP